MGFSATHRTSYIKRNINACPHQSRITFHTLLWDTLYLSIIILTKLTALAVHYAITILLPRPRNKRELQVYYGLVVCTHRVAHWFKLLSKEAFLFSWSCTIHIIFAPSLQSLLVMRQLTTRIGIHFVPKVHILLCNSYRVTRLGLSQGLKIRSGGGGRFVVLGRENVSPWLR